MFKKLKNSAFIASTAAVTSVLTATSAFAAIDVQAINDAKDDVATVGAAAFAVIIAAAAFKYVRRAL